MMHRPLCFLTLLSLSLLPLSAQGETPKDRLGFSKIAEGESKGCCPDRWTCIIDGADKAMTIVKLSSITSISKQTYMLEGTQRIQEVTIDTEGNNSIRFYCLSSERTRDLLNRGANTRELVDRRSDNATRLPAKKYPEATHSHNVEFQLSSPELLHQVYESVTHAWVKNISLNLHLKN